MIYFWWQFMKTEELLLEAEDLVAKLSTMNGSDLATSKHLYLRAFDLLLRDSDHGDSIFAKLIKEPQKPEAIQRYAQVLKSLNATINGLDSAHPLKEVLQERLLDNVNYTSIDRLEKNFSANPEGACATFIAANKPAHVVNTVEVRTWGTEREYSNGLRNVVDQKLRSDDVGHAAVVMRLAADEEGLRLVRQYCMDQSGKTIIPYELKRIGNQVVYEVYWSYWPSILHTMEQDYEHERRGLEYRDIKELDRSVPKELSDKYIVHKYRNGQMTPFAAASERVTVSTEQGIGSERTHFLDLKEKEIRLKEELETIDVMMDNYFAKGKNYSPSKTFSNEQIKKTSNFYQIIFRFRDQLQPPNIVAKVLHNKKISTEDTKVLISSFQNLKGKREKELGEVQNQLKEAQESIQSTHAADTELQERMKSAVNARTGLTSMSILRKKSEIEEIQVFLLSCRRGEFPIAVPNRIKDLLNESGNILGLREGSAIEEVTAKGKIGSEEELDGLIEEIKSVEAEVQRLRLVWDSDSVSDIMRERVGLFSDERRGKQIALAGLIDKNQKKIEELRVQITELDTVISTYPKANPVEAIKEITQLEKDVKKLLNDKSLEGKPFTYKLDGVQHEVILSTQVVKTLEELCAQKKAQLPALKAQIKDSKIVLKSQIDKTGRSVEITSLAEAEANRKTTLVQLDKLLDRQKRLDQKMQVAELSTTTHASEIERRQIRRGYPYKASTLTGMNIEEMLKTARSMAGTVSNFNLKIENCSTTSMKLLHAGSAESRKQMFVASKPPVVATQYQLALKPEGTSAKQFKPNTIYLKVINSVLTYTVVDYQKNLQKDVTLPGVHASEPLDLTALEQYKAQIIKDIGEKGFTDEFEYDSEAFLTNPQAVYAAARVCERVDAGDKQAIEVAKRMTAPDSRNRVYHQLINKLSSKSNEELKSPWSLLSLTWEFIKHPSAIVSLYRDYKNPIKEENPEFVAVESQLRDIEVAIRNLSDDKHYLYVGSGTPAVAINKMLELLQSSPKAIPYFTKDKYEEVNDYMLALADKGGPEAQTTLKAIKKIISERDKRVELVEKALANGRDVQAQLLSSAEKSAISKVVFPFTKQDLMEHKIDLFIQGVRKEREAQPLSFLRSNFAKELQKLETLEEKTRAIEKHIAEKPKSRTALVWRDYVQQDPVVKKVETANAKVDEAKDQVDAEKFSQQRHLHTLLGVSRETVRAAAMKPASADEEVDIVFEREEKPPLAADRGSAGILTKKTF